MTDGRRQSVRAVRRGAGRVAEGGCGLTFACTGLLATTYCALISPSSESRVERKRPERERASGARKTTTMAGGRTLTSSSDSVCRWGADLRNAAARGPASTLPASRARRLCLYAVHDLLAGDFAMCDAPAAARCLRPTCPRVCLRPLPGDQHRAVAYTERGPDSALPPLSSAPAGGSRFATGPGLLRRNHTDPGPAWAPNTRQTLAHLESASLRASGGGYSSRDSPSRPVRTTVAVRPPSRSTTSSCTRRESGLASET